MSRTLCIGDIHGCVEELKDLLLAIDFRRGVDRLVLLGDLIDRGPAPAEVVALAMEIGADRVQGNHEEKALRWLKHRDRAAANPDYQNPMRPPFPEREREWLSLSDAQLRWLDASPAYLDLRNEWLAAHAGFEPGTPIDKQRADTVMRIRYVDHNGKMVKQDQDDTAQPKKTSYWADLWDGLWIANRVLPGPKNIIFGHAVHSLIEPRIWESSDGLRCVGLDTGCCFGGHLSAAIFETGFDRRNEIKFAKVKAKREYMPLPMGQMGVES